MVEKELFVKIIAYNLVKRTILNSSDENPEKYSFKIMRDLIVGSKFLKSKKAINFFNLLIKKERLNSKFRIEPRKIKRRRRGTFQLLTIPRNEWKSLNGHS